MSDEGQSFTTPPTPKQIKCRAKNAQRKHRDKVLKALTNKLASLSPLSEEEEAKEEYELLKTYESILNKWAQNHRFMYLYTLCMLSPWQIDLNNQDNQDAKHILRQYCLLSERTMPKMEEFISSMYTTEEIKTFQHQFPNESWEAMVEKVPVQIKYPRNFNGYVKCAFCSKDLSSSVPIPCAKCGWVEYCSQHCADEASKAFNPQSLSLDSHGIEMIHSRICSSLAPLPAQFQKMYMRKLLNLDQPGDTSEFRVNQLRLEMSYSRVFVLHTSLLIQFVEFAAAGTYNSDELSQLQKIQITPEQRQEFAEILALTKFIHMHLNPCTLIMVLVQCGSVISSTYKFPVGNCSHCHREIKKKKSSIAAKNVSFKTRALIVSAKMSTIHTV
jgi:hypothetical protein